MLKNLGLLSLKALIAVLFVIITGSQAQAQRYTMNLSNVSTYYQQDFDANSNWMWVNTPPITAGWKVVVSYQTSWGGGNLYGITVTFASLAGNPAMVQVAQDNGWAVAWLKVSPASPTLVGGLIFRYPATDEWLPWATPPRYPLASGVPLTLAAVVVAYTAPPDPVFGYSAYNRVQFNFNFTVKAPQY